MEVTCANVRCGAVFPWRGGPAHFARAAQHYCSRSCQNTTHGLAGTLRHRIWERAKKRAKENGVHFDLRVEDVPEVPTRCPVLDIEIRANTIAGPLDSSPSIDRICLERGYIAGNVRIVSNRANRLRSDGSAAELALIAADAAALERRC